VEVAIRTEKFVHFIVAYPNFLGKLANFIEPMSGSRKDTPAWQDAVREKRKKTLPRPLSTTGVFSQ
jgi:hypothetical protein